MSKWLKVIRYKVRIMRHKVYIHHPLYSSNYKSPHVTELLPSELVAVSEKLDVTQLVVFTHCVAAAPMVQQDEKWGWVRLISSGTMFSWTSGSFQLEDFCCSGCVRVLVGKFRQWTRKTAEWGVSCEVCVQQTPWELCAHVRVLDFGF